MVAIAFAPLFWIRFDQLRTVGFGASEWTRDCQRIIADPAVEAHLGSILLYQRRTIALRWGYAYKR